MALAKRPTIRDVAELGGVSMATVSNVVNGHAHVREGTRQRVRDAIEALGYKPSRAAKSLPAGRTFMLAYCLPGSGSPNSALDVFLHQIVSSASDADLELLLFAQTRNDALQPYVELLRSGGADGFILSDIEYEDTRVEYLNDRRIPFVCFGRVDNPLVQWVDVDGAAGIRAAVDHVYTQGHERLAFVGWPQGSATGDDRLAGFVDMTRSLELEPGSVVRVINDFDAGRKALPDLIQRHAPSAIVCVSDTVALGVMAGLRDLGLSPGNDVLVTGFDDIPAASLTAPGLTSLRQPMDQIGALLVERLVALLTGEDPPAPMLVEPDLIVRQSTTGNGAATAQPEPNQMEGNP